MRHVQTHAYAIRRGVYQHLYNNNDKNKNKNVLSYNDNDDDDDNDNDRNKITHLRNPPPALCMLSILCL
jgi:hypothetical protein